MFGLSVANPFASLGQKLLSDLGLPQTSAPVTGGTPDASGTPTNFNLRSPSTGGDTLDDYAQKIGHMESGNRYGIKGPLLRDGDRAFGRYQVLGKNVGPWTEAATGKRLTPQEFLRDPQAQDAVFKHQFGGYLQKYGNPQDAASMWFSGRPYAAGSKLRDQVTNISGRQYVAGTVGTGDASVAEAMGHEAKPGSPLATGGQGTGTSTGGSRFDYTGSPREGPYSASEQKKHSVEAPKLADNRPEPLAQDTDPYQGPTPETMQALHAGDTSVLQRLPPEIAVDAIRAYGEQRRLTTQQAANASPMGGVAQAGNLGIAMTGGIRG